MKTSPKSRCCVLPVLALCVLLLPLTSAFTVRHPPGPLSSSNDPAPLSAWEAAPASPQENTEALSSPWGNSMREMLVRKLRRYRGGEKRGAMGFQEDPNDPTNYWETRMGHEGLHDSMPMQWMKRRNSI